MPVRNFNQSGTTPDYRAAGCIPGMKVIGPNPDRVMNTGREPGKRAETATTGTAAAGIGIKRRAAA